MPYKKKVYKPGKLRKPPPFMEDNVLKNIGLGITISEGTALCMGRSPALAVVMCDQKAIELVSKSWGVAVTRGTRKTCPSTPQNPEGYAYRVNVSGTRAHQIMKEYEPYIIGTEIYKKWERKKEECPKRIAKPRPRKR